MKLSIAILTNIILLYTVNGFAKLMGPSTGGGGFAISCPKTPLEPAQTMLLDLYEAEEVYKFQLVKASNNLEEDYFRSAQRVYSLQGYPHLAESLRSDISNGLRNFFRSVRFVENISELPVANDLGEVPWVPSQCKIQQMAYFDDQSSTIYILKPLWDKFDSLSQAALAQHELSYKYQRLLGEKTSKISRIHVGHAFSAAGPTPVSDGLSSDSFSFSFKKDERLSVLEVTHGYSLGRPTARLQFNQIGGQPLLSKTWVDFALPIWDLAHAYDPSENNFSCVVKNPNTHIITSAPLLGLYTSYFSANLEHIKFTVELEYITNQPVKITIRRADGSIMTSGSLRGSCKK